MSLRVVALLNEHRMRDGVVVQAGDVPEAERQVYRRLPVWTEKGAILGGMLVGTQSHMEGPLDGRHRAD